MTKQLRAGSGITPQLATAVANTLRDTFPDPIHLLTGLTLPGDKGRNITLDLVILTQMAAFVGMATPPQTDNAIAPRPAAELLALLIQQQRLIPQALPVYAFWVGPTAPANDADKMPHLRDAAAVQEFILLAGSQETRLLWPSIIALADRLYQLDVKPVKLAVPTPQRSPTPPLRRALRRLGGLPGRVDAGLQEFIRQPLFLHGRKAIQPADVNRYLERAMLDRENALEGVDYSKIAPNDYLVEINSQNYEQNYRPIARQVTDQWQTMLLEALNTANGRMGRREYKFGGPVRVAVRPNPDLKPGEVRVLCRINQDVSPAPTAAAASNGQGCLETLPDGPVLKLPDGVTTIGRSQRADIHLDTAVIQETRLVSGIHAYFVVENGQTRLFDGSPSGIASSNGTFINGRLVSAAGQELQEGDLIILAALDAKNPRRDTLGVAVFSFQRDCA